MNGASKTRLKLIWRAGGVVGALGAMPAMWGAWAAGAEWLPVLVAGLVAGVFTYFIVIWAGVQLFARALLVYIGEQDVRRVGTDVEVTSGVAATGDADLDDYVRGYARASDALVKTVILLLTAGILIVAIRLIHGPFLFLQ